MDYNASTIRLAYDALNRLTNMVDAAKYTYYAGGLLETGRFLIMTHELPRAEDLPAPELRQAGGPKGSVLMID